MRQLFSFQPHGTPSNPSGCQIPQVPTQVGSRPFAAPKRPVESHLPVSLTSLRVKFFDLGPLRLQPPCPCTRAPLSQSLTPQSPAAATPCSFLLTSRHLHLLCSSACSVFPRCSPGALSPPFMSEVTFPGGFPVFTNLKRQTPHPVTQTHTSFVSFIFHHFLTSCLINSLWLVFSWPPLVPSHPIVGFLLPEGKTISGSPVPRTASVHQLLHLIHSCMVQTTQGERPL